MPDQLEEEIIYISLEYGSMLHLCACGCREEVNTPLSPTGWKLTYDGKDVTLDPSIGNWNFECRSHYWIRGSEVMWAEDWSDYQVKISRKSEQEKTATYYEINKFIDESKKVELRKTDSVSAEESKLNLWDRFLAWINF